MKNWRNQTSRSGGDKDAAKKDDADPNSHVLSFKQIMQDVNLFGAFTWKERKQMENQKVVELGGKPVKKQRLPLSVARVEMKNQKKREEKMLAEELALGRFKSKTSGGARKFGDKRKPENRVLKTTEGFFKNGVLDVKDLLKSGGASSSEGRFSDGPMMMDRGRKQMSGGGGKKKNSGKKNGKGKGKGKGKKRH